MGRVCLIAALVMTVAGALCSAQLGWAQPSAQPFRLDYSETPGCAAREEFYWQLQARTHRLRRAHPGEQALMLTVRLSVTGDQVDGLVELREPDGRATMRHVSGETCSEVVAALALVTAVMVDPDALTEPVIPGGSGRRVEPAVSAPPAPPPEPRPWRFGLLGGASLQTAAAPEPLLVYAAEIEVLPAPGWLPEPVLALSLHRGRSDPIEKHGGQAELAWTSGRLTACPTRWPARAPAAFRPCLSLDVGALRGTAGSGVENPASRGALWLAPGGVIRWELLVGDWLVVVADGGALFPLVRTRFYFGPSADKGTVYRTPVAGLTAGVRAGVHFP
jgi:hypothetical protein